MRLSRIQDLIEAGLENDRNVFILLSSAGFTAYLNSLSIPFHLDDYGSIVNNYAIHHLFDFKGLWNFYASRIVLYFTLSLNYAIHNEQVFGYHLINLLIHITNGLLLFSIINRLLKLPYFRGSLPAGHSRLIAALSAVLFVVHPIQVNAVSYIVQRTASLAATFYLASVLMFISYRTKNKLRYFAGMLLFILLAMFTKENTITIPFMLLVIELFFFTGDGSTPWHRRLVVFTAIFATLAVIPGTALFLNGHSQSDPGNDFKASTSMDRMQYFYTELNVVSFYIRLMLIPDRQNFDYGNDWPVSAGIWDNNAYISLAVLLLTAFSAVLSVKRNRLAAFGIFWFFLGLAVESSFISIKDVYFEHRLYLSCAGFVMFLAGMIFFERKPSLPGRRTYFFRKPMLLFLIVAFLSLPVYTGLTMRRNYIYSDSIRLWTDVVEKAPGSDRAHSVLGTSYLNAFEENKNRAFLDMAEKEILKSLELNYFSGAAHSNLSKIYLHRGDLRKCIEEAGKALTMDGAEYAAYNMGKAYEKLGDRQSALNAYLHGYAANYRSTFILYALGNIYYEMADYKNSIRYFSEYADNNRIYDNTAVEKKIADMKRMLMK